MPYNGPDNRQKLLLSIGDLDPHVIHVSLGQHESAPCTESRCLQPFMHSTSVWQTDRHTHSTLRVISITIGRIYVNLCSEFLSNTLNALSVLVGREKESQFESWYRKINVFFTCLNRHSLTSVLVKCYITKLLLSLGDLDPHVIHVSLGQHESAPCTGSGPPALPPLNYTNYLLQWVKNDAE